MTLGHKKFGNPCCTAWASPAVLHVRSHTASPAVLHVRSYEYSVTCSANFTQKTSRIFFRTQKKWSRGYKTCMRHQSKRPHFLCNILFISSSMTSNNAELLKFQFRSALPLFTSQLHFPKEFYLTALAHSHDKTECTKQYIFAIVRVSWRWPCNWSKHVVTHLYNNTISRVNGILLNIVFCNLPTTKGWIR